MSVWTKVYQPLSFVVDMHRLLMADIIKYIPTLWQMGLNVLPCVGIMSLRVCSVQKRHHDMKLRLSCQVSRNFCAYDRCVILGGIEMNESATISRRAGRSAFDMASVDARDVRPYRVARRGGGCERARRLFTKCNGQDAHWPSSELLASVPYHRTALPRENVRPYYIFCMNLCNATALNYIYCCNSNALFDMTHLQIGGRHG